MMQASAFRMKAKLLLTVSTFTVVCQADDATVCKADMNVGRCTFGFKGCFRFQHGPSTCRRVGLLSMGHCFCNPGYCSIDGKRCIPEASAPVPTPPPGAGGEKTALFVIGTEPGQPLFADAIYKEKLEEHGFRVVLIKDTQVDDTICEKHSIMLVSASIDGNAVKDRLNKCSRPSMHWEMGLWLHNGMTKEQMGVDAWLTHENRFARVPKGPTGAWPPRPQGGNILITKDGAEYGELAAGLGPGEVTFFEDGFYGMNWASVDSLGSGAKVVALLPFPTAPKPDVDKAVLFYYPKGAELAPGHGLSPSLRIGFIPFHYSHGTDPTCEELTEAQKECSGCSRCHTTAEMEASVKPMPLTKEGLQILDDAIRMLDEASRTGAAESIVYS